jgi:hypothetical protein
MLRAPKEALEDDPKQALTPVQAAEAEMRLIKLINPPFGS